MTSPDDAQRRDSLAAIGELAKSKRLRPLYLWIAGLVYSAAIASAGWFVSKLDTRSEIQRLAGLVAQQTGELAIMNGRMKELSETIDGLSAPAHDEKPPGLLLQLGEQMRIVRREQVASHAAVYAGELPTTRSKKRAAADQFTTAYDTLVRQGEAPASAAYRLIDQVAIP